MTIMKISVLFFPLRLLPARFCLAIFFHHPVLAAHHKIHLAVLR